MPSSPKIPRERILDKALEMLIRDGYQSINITSLAKELGCSTQPISWQFGGMEGLRRELTEAAFEYASDHSEPEGDNPVAALEKTGDGYLDLAFDVPNLVRFIALEAQGHRKGGKLLSVINQERNESLIEGLEEVMGVSQEDVRAFMQDVVIYTHGLAILIATGVVRETRQKAYQLLKSAGVKNMVAVGLPLEKAKALLGMK